VVVVVVMVSDTVALTVTVFWPSGPVKGVAREPEKEPPVGVEPAREAVWKPSAAVAVTAWAVME
jgi:hypothetical protein